MILFCGHYPQLVTIDEGRKTFSLCVASTPAGSQDLSVICFKAGRKGRKWLFCSGTMWEIQRWQQETHGFPQLTFMLSLSWWTGQMQLSASFRSSAIILCYRMRVMQERMTLLKRTSAHFYRFVHFSCKSQWGCSQPGKFVFFFLCRLGPKI